MSAAFTVLYFVPNMNSPFLSHFYAQQTFYRQAKEKKTMLVFCPFPLHSYICVIFRLKDHFYMHYILYHVNMCYTVVVNFNRHFSLIIYVYLTG